jgi:hypothetical protein
MMSEEKEEENAPAIETRGLNAFGIFKADCIQGIQFYHVVSTDIQGNQYISVFSCPMNFTDLMDKAFSRLSPFKLGEQEEEKKIEVIH